jgi:hypothetical protein
VEISLGIAKALLSLSIGVASAFTPTPTSPILASVSAALGYSLLAMHPASESRTSKRKREEQCQKEESALAVVQESVAAADAALRQKAESIQVAQSCIEGQAAYLQTKEQAIFQAQELLQKQSKQLEEWAIQQQQQYLSLAAKTLEENRSLKRPDKLENISYEDGVANEIITLLWEHGVIIKKPFLRPFDDGSERGFELTFTILPALPDLDARGKEKHYIQSLEECRRKITKDLLADVQSKVYACDKLPTIVPVYDGLKLRVCLGHFQGQYQKLQEEEEQRVLASVAEHGFAGAIANEIIDFYHKQNIRLDFVDAHQFDQDEVMVWVKSHYPDGKFYKIEEICNAFESGFKSKFNLEVEKEGEFLSFLWNRSHYAELTKVRDKDGQEITIEEPEDKDWFVSTITDPKSVHHLIHGPTGSGKSVLVDNIFSVASDDLSAATGKKVNIHICDPKFPDSEWTFRGRRIKPEYRRWDGAVEGVLKMNEEVNERLDIAARAAEAVPDDLFADPSYILPLPERDIDFWAVDEAAALHERHEKQIGSAYRETAWVARSALVKMVLIGQNPNCSNYGLQIPDLANFVRWYLGITALEAIDKVIKPPREVKAYLKKQIYARLRLTKQKKMQGEKNPKEQYFCLVWANTGEPFIAQLPPLKAFSDRGEASDNVAVITSTSTLIDIVKEVKKETTEKAYPELENILETSFQNLMNNLPQHLRDVYEFAKKRDTWIRGSDLVRNKNSYKKCPTKLIEDWFRELDRLGIGGLQKPKKSLMYHWSPPATNATEITEVRDES